MGASGAPKVLVTTAPASSGSAAAFDAALTAIDTPASNLSSDLPSGGNPLSAAAVDARRGKLF